MLHTKTIDDKKNIHKQDSEAAENTTATQKSNQPCGHVHALQSLTEGGGTGVTYMVVT
jgi:hypothetical protein